MLEAEAANNALAAVHQAGVALHEYALDILWMPACQYTATPFACRHA
jgi:hypothetical protein